MRNGREIIDERLEVSEVIESVEDEGWKTEDLQRIEEELEEERREEREAREDESEPKKAERMDSIATMAADGVGL